MTFTRPHPFLFASFILVALCGGLAAGESVRASVGSLFNPAELVSAGKLNLRKGDSITFDTGSAERAPSFSGTMSGKGIIGLSKSGKTTMAVFTFDDVNLGDSGTKVLITGQLPIVIVSKAGFALGTTMSVSGTDAVDLASVAGASAERPAFGAFAATPIEAGTGARGGAGGWGGGLGGGASPNGRPVTVSSASAAEDAQLNELTGGQDGQPGVAMDGSVVRGGGGGGAIAIIAMTKISLSANGFVLANGGNGSVVGRTGSGGGGGGSVILAAPIIIMRYGKAAAIGGIGGSGGPGVAAEILTNVTPRQFGSGGGGGGGRIACYLIEDIGWVKATPGKDRQESPLMAYIGAEIDGGRHGLSAVDGAIGTVWDGTWPGWK